jgi:hypothetical protein
MESVECSWGEIREILFGKPEWRVHLERKIRKLKKLGQRLCT